MLLYQGLLDQKVLLLSLEIRLFWLVVGLYLLSLLFHLLYFFEPTPPKWGKRATKLLLMGALLHTMVIFLRTIEAQRPPFQTLYESLSWFAWSGVVTYLFMKRKWRDIFASGFMVTLVALLACLYSLFVLSPEITSLVPALQSGWFLWHGILAFMSYAVFVVAASVEVTCLFFRASKNVASRYGLPSASLGLFRKEASRLILFGFPLLTFGIISGAAWANEAWGRYWSWDPKEVWSLITWTVFALYLHCLSLPKWRDLPASLLNLLGFICMIMTFVGINWLSKLLGIPSLHAYA